MKVGDLVIIKPEFGGDGDVSPMLVVYISPTKKTWHRRVILLKGKDFLTVSWTNKHRYKVI